MKVFGRTAVSEFLDDFVVYRNLQPVDQRLSGLDAVRDAVGLPPGRLPRKSEVEYAQVIVNFLQQARALDAPGTPLQRLVFVGDTHLNDGRAFANICQASGWSGLAFIGAETTDPAEVQIVNAPSTNGDNAPMIFLANRWSALANFDRYCADRGFPIDPFTAVVVDLDKTALGARGRNAHVIDEARVAAVRDTVADLLGGVFNPVTFQAAYDELNQPEYHPFTADNQDYLAYICLIVGGGLCSLEQVVTDVKSDKLNSFNEFIARVDKQVGELPINLAAIHSEIYSNVRTGDPTPFKPFRYNEYLTTVARLGHMGDDATAQDLLENEIVITQEVRVHALQWRARGALLFGLSDKPDEASVPSDALAAQGYRAIHRTESHAVGE
jgi:hypothetical protein